METKYKVEIKKTKRGVTIWVNGRWVMDASLFNEEMSFDIETYRMKQVNEGHYKYDRRKK